MLIVAIDTSGRNGSIALSRDGVPPTVEPLAGGTYSAQLIPALDRLLRNNHLDKSSIDAFVVASGPGSFTGLRVGLSTVKALADALHKPIAAVSVLEAIAVQANAQGRFLVALDAGRKQVFVGEFQIAGAPRKPGFGLPGDVPTPLSEHLLDTSVFAAQLKSGSAPVFTPDSNLVEALHATLVPQPMADLYARMGAERIAAGKTISPAELDANYIRRSDAEIFFRQ